MKAIKIFIFAIMSILILPLTSCNDDEPQKPLIDGSKPLIHFHFFINTSEMFVNDIAFDVNEITIINNEKVYNIETKMYPPTPLVGGLLDSGEYYLRFLPHSRLLNDSFTIDYGNGVTDVFRYSWGGILSEDSKSTIWLDEKKYEFFSHDIFIRLNNWGYDISDKRFED